MFEFDEVTRKKLEDLEFVESASTNVDTQNALLEALDTDDETKGRFNTAEDMFAHMQKEWDND